MQDLSFYGAVVSGVEFHHLKIGLDQVKSIKYAICIYLKLNTFFFCGVKLLIMLN